MTITIECEQVADGRWLAEVPQLPGVLVYGDTRSIATQLVLTLAFRVAEELKQSGLEPADSGDAFGRRSEHLLRAGASSYIS